jgi:hypothetical protein
MSMISSLGYAKSLEKNLGPISKHKKETQILEWERDLMRCIF